MKSDKIQKLRNIFQKKPTTLKSIAPIAVGLAIGTGNITGLLPKTMQEDKIKEGLSGYTDELIGDTPGIKTIENIAKDKKEQSIEESDKEGELQEDQLLTAYRVICTSGLDLRARPIQDDDNTICTVNFNDIVYAYQDAITKKEDGKLWGLVEYYNHDEDEVITGFLSMEDCYVERYYEEQEYESSDIALYGDEEIEITDEDIKKLVNFTCSWENQPLYAYTTGCEGYSYSSEYIVNHITEDGKYYICNGDGTDNGTKNYGFGININDDGEPNMQTVSIFAELGYDVTKEEYLKLGESKLPVDVVDKVTEEYIIFAVENVQRCLKEKNVKFSKSEILALSAICYQFGRGESFINYFIDSYVKNGGNTEKFKDNYYTSGGTQVFHEVAGGDIKYNGVIVDRAEAYWNAFHNGVYIMGSGKEADVQIEIEKANEQENIQDNNEDVAKNDPNIKNNDKNIKKYDDNYKKDITDAYGNIIRPQPYKIAKITGKTDINTNQNIPKNRIAIDDDFER